MPKPSGGYDSYYAQRSENKKIQKSRASLRLAKGFDRPWFMEHKPQEVKVKARNYKCLNVTAEYGRREVWKPTKGSVEFTQNVRDGLIGFAKSEGVDHHNLTCTVTTIENPREPDNCALDETVYALRLSQAKKHKMPVGWVAVRPSAISKRRIDIEFFNRTEVTDMKKPPVDLFSALTFGHSSKRDDPDTAGEHGDGLKMVSCAQTRKGIKIDYFRESTPFFAPRLQRVPKSVF
jgi:hypothetical protein